MIESFQVDINDSCQQVTRLSSCRFEGTFFHLLDRNGIVFT